MTFNIILTLSLCMVDFECMYNMYTNVIIIFYCNLMNMLTVQSLESCFLLFLCVWADEAMIRTVKQKGILIMN